MVSTVKSRPNYYEMLGLTPSAAGDAIAQAFARATNVFRPHPFGGIAEICMAYETLRDPAKRRAYDASLGLATRPSSPPATRPASAHFMVRPALAAPLPAAPSAAPKPQPAPMAEMLPAQLDPPPPSPFAFDRRSSAEASPIEWKRAGTAVGGLVVGAVLVGALAGWWSGRDAAQAAPPTPAVSTVQPPEEKVPSFSELWPDPRPRTVETRLGRTQFAQQRRAAVVRPKVERPRQRTQVTASGAESQLIQPPQDLASANPADPLAPEAAPAMATAMPLPHRTVARTIDRIGYACGSVASAVPVEGAAGIFKVTCTSGQSFQATPVNGRYRFRRVGRN